MLNIRTAILSDAKNLAELAERTFVDAFGDQNSDEDIKLHCQSNFGEAIQTEEISNPDYVVLVVENDDDLVAYAQLRWGECPSCISANAPGEIQRIYVDKSWHGKGLAQELMAACLTIMVERSTDVVWLGVWEKNPRAISFYKKLSFREVGGHIFNLGKDRQQDIIMVREVTGL